MSTPRIHRLQLPTRTVGVVWMGREQGQDYYAALPLPPGDGHDLTDAELVEVDMEIARRHSRFWDAYRRAVEADIDALYTDLGGEGG